MKTNTSINTLTLIICIFLMFLSTQAFAQQETVTKDPCLIWDNATKEDLEASVDKDVKKACSKLLEPNLNGLSEKEQLKFLCSQTQWNAGGILSKEREVACIRTKPDYNPCLEIDILTKDDWGARVYSSIRDDCSAWLSKQTKGMDEKEEIKFICAQTQWNSGGVQTHRRKEACLRIENEPYRKSDKYKSYACPIKPEGVILITFKERYSISTISSHTYLENGVEYTRVDAHLTYHGDVSIAPDPTLINKNNEPISVVERVCMINDTKVIKPGQTIPDGQKFRCAFKLPVKEGIHPKDFGLRGKKDATSHTTFEAARCGDFYI